MGVKETTTAKLCKCSRPRLDRFRWGVGGGQLSCPGGHIKVVASKAKSVVASVTKLDKILKVATACLLYTRPGTVGKSSLGYVSACRLASFPLYYPRLSSP